MGRWGSGGGGGGYQELPPCNHNRSCGWRFQVIDPLMQELPVPSKAVQVRFSGLTDVGVL